MNTTQSNHTSRQAVTEDAIVAVKYIPGESFLEEDARYSVHVDGCFHRDCFTYQEAIEVALKLQPKTSRVYTMNCPLSVMDKQFAPKARKAYYAHCVAIYDSQQEARDMDMLTVLLPDTEIVNPNNPEYSACYKTEGMAFFERLMMTGMFDVFVFRALPDGSVPCGVAKELAMFRLAYPKRPVFELPCCVTRRTLSLDETREYLQESGNR